VAAAVAAVVELPVAAEGIVVAVELLVGVVVGRILDIQTKAVGSKQEVGLVTPRLLPLAGEDNILDIHREEEEEEEKIQAVGQLVMLHSLEVQEEEGSILGIHKEVEGSIQVAGLVRHCRLPWAGVVDSILDIQMAVVGSKKEEVHSLTQYLPVGSMQEVDTVAAEEEDKLQHRGCCRDSCR